jgi:hypothetical protein
MVALPPAARDCSVALDASLPRAASSLHVRAAEPPSMAVATPTQLGGSPTLQKGGLDLFQSTPTQEPQTDDNGGDDNGGGKITNDGGGVTTMMTTTTTTSKTTTGMMTCVTCLVSHTFLSRSFFSFV